MSNQSFKVKNGLTLSPIDLTTLLSPQAGDLACDINDSNKIKRYDALSASWVEVGSGAAGDVDTLLVQDFDSASLSSFTQTGLTLITTNPLDGRQSARLIHQPLAGAVQSFKETFSVSPKFRGVNMTASLLLRSSASQGNVTIQFRDETNSVDYPSQQLQTNSQVIASLVTNSTTTVSGFSNSVINSLKVGMSVTGSGIPTGTTIASINSTALTITLSQAATASATVSLRFSDLPRTIQLGFQIPANCSSYSYTISALQEAGSPETYIDDIVLKNYWLGMSNQGQSTISVQTVTTQTTAIQQTANFTNSIITGSASSASGSNIYIYNSTNGTYTFLVDAIVDANLSLRTSAGAFVQAEIRIDSNIVAISLSQNSVGYWATTAFTGRVNAGQVVTFLNNSATTSDQQRISLAAQAITTSQVTTTDLVPAKAVLGNTSLEIPSITGWQGYTPTFQGFGTPTNVEFEWRQVGENVEIRGKFTVGIVTNIEARVGLPAGLTSASTSLIPSLQTCGVVGYNIGTAAAFYSLIEPSVTYLTIGRQTSATGGLTKVNGNLFTSSTDVLSFFASVPCSGLSATEEVVVSGTQSALVQNADANLKMYGFTGYGSSSTAILRFTTTQESEGSSFTYSSSSINGDSITILESGIYSITAGVKLTSTSDALQIGIAKNLTLPFTGGPGSFTQATRLSVSSDRTNTTVANDKLVSTSWTGKLNANDVIYISSGQGGLADAWLTVSKQGSLKQLNVSSDQKITIPTSELRFEGASSRGSTATAIVKFDTLAKLRGDAFTVESDAVLGTRITMLKAGKLDVSSSIYSTAAGQQLAITKNSSTLVPATVFNVASELLSTEYTTGTSDVLNVSYSGYVSVGDIIRIAANVAMVANPSNNLNLAFQEQDISVSVTNTLPQFSDSDSSVRLDTANGYGSTPSNKIRRFSNVRDNIGTDIEYVDSPTNGASFTVRSSGIYNISYTDQTTVATYIGISKNSAELTTSIGSINVINRLAIGTTDTTSGYPETVSWQGYLQAGDIIRAHTDGGASGASIDRAQFTISKVGKPNVTGVDVTPFVNVPQPDVAYYTAYNSPNGFGSTYTQAPRFLSVQRNDGTGILSYTDSATLGGFWTANKNCKVDINLSGVYLSSAAYTLSIYKNQTSVGSATALTLEEGAANLRNGTSTTVSLVAGDTIRFYYSSTSMNRTAEYVSIVAEALSDQILTAPETFSTDTASLRYANASEYTLSTLANAPVGTYITFTTTINTTNSHIQTTGTNRPAQTDSDMNVNGIRIFTRSYSQASTFGSPSYVALQIGKGMKGLTINGYDAISKSGDLIKFDQGFADGSVQVGAFYAYNEVTGILLLDAATSHGSAYTNRYWLDNTGNASTSGYFVINASKNPALTGLNVLLPRIATLSDVKASGTAGGTATSGSYQTRTLNTLSDPTGIVTSLASNQFTLPAGEYYIDANAFAFNCELHKIRIQNITDSSTALLGAVAYSRVVSNAATTAFLSGNIVITSAKTFELQHRVGATQASTGFGLATSFGDNEVYANIKITKVK